ncbi:hypothetical protein [Amycolatopsis sp. cmx-11-51]
MLAEVLAGRRDQDGIAGARLRPAVLADDGERIIRFGEYLSYESYGEN